MAYQMIAFKTNEFNHHEVGHLFYKYTSLSEQYLIAKRLKYQHRADFIIVLGNDGEPKGEIDC